MRRMVGAVVGGLAGGVVGRMRRRMVGGMVGAKVLDRGNTNRAETKRIEDSFYLCRHQCRKFATPPSVCLWRAVHPAPQEALCSRQRMRDEFVAMRVPVGVARQHLNWKPTQAVFRTCRCSRATPTGTTIATNSSLIL